MDRYLLRKWRLRNPNVLLFLTATEYSKKLKELKVSLSLHCISDEARKVYNTFNVSSVTHSLKFNKVIEEFEAYFAPKKNITSPVSSFSHTDRTLPKSSTIFRVIYKK